MVDPAISFSSASSAGSWVAAKKVPADAFKVWYDGSADAYRMRLIADDRGGYVMCTPVNTISGVTGGVAVRPITALHEICNQMDWLGRGAGFWSGFPEGVWPFFDRPDTVSSGYVRGYWFGRIIFILFSLFVGLIIILGFFSDN